MVDSVTPISFLQKYSLRAQVLRIEHLTRQWEHLRLVHTFHLQSIPKVQDPDIREMYRDIVASLELAICQYEVLLAELRQSYQAERFL